MLEASTTCVVNFITIFGMASFSVSVLVARFAAMWDDHQFVETSFPSSSMLWGSRSSCCPRGILSRASIL